jgi:hypothetical protein
MARSGVASFWHLLSVSLFHCLLNVLQKKTLLQIIIVIKAKANDLQAYLLNILSERLHSITFLIAAFFFSEERRKIIFFTNLRLHVCINMSVLFLDVFSRISVA